MKYKYLFLTFVACLLTLSMRGECQPKYKNYFENRTLRVDYYRTGCRAWDTLELSRFVAKHGEWAGSKTVLIDPFDNGDYLVEMVDSLSGKVLYSRGYNTLFREYRDTKPGADSVAHFQEVVLLPWPKEPCLIRFSKRDSLQVYHVQTAFLFNPRTSRTVTLQGSPTPMEVERHGESAKKLDVVIVPEGYGPSESKKLSHDVLTFRDYLFAQEPFHGRRNDFNVWSLNALGEESGITNPGKHLSVNSAVGATYYTFGSDRYLMTFELFKLHDLLDAIEYDQIIIMANSAVYGGGAIYNFYAVSAVQEMSHYILPHELGHSIGGLADEYVDDELSYNEMHKINVEPVEPNITTLVDFGSKWKNMLPKGTPVPTPDNKEVGRKENGPLGVYEGAGYLPKGIYRPVMHCMMRDYAPFCPVCTLRLNEVFDIYCK